ncbi:ATP-binding protein [Leucobacter sp. OH2974_COT-288]|nr:ATP-binding protein [Leucobacter sp. OH2974_COT-288]
MGNSKNPFTATLGATPPLLVGRQQEVADFELALDSGPGSHERVSLIVGARGSGKTVMLDRFALSAQQRGWLVFTETATSGFTERLKRRVVRELQREEKELGGKTLTSFGIEFFSLGLYLTWDTNPNIRDTYDLRDALTDLLQLQTVKAEQFNLEPSGVLITLDELHHRRNNEVIELGAITQHLVREDREIAVVMAGIPSAIKPLLAADRGKNPVTFLRRANLIELEPIPQQEVMAGLQQPMQEAGIVWDSQALQYAAAECGGYPFMIQLIGSQAFRTATSKHVTMQLAETAVTTAKRRLNKLVHEPSLADLSDVDRAFLQAMAHDDGPSKISDIANRLGQSPQYTNNYRKRLIDAEMILTAGSGKVTFALPHLREYLRELQQAEHSAYNF